jgi:Fur family ferric uptake transcriptional regulator
MGYNTGKRERILAFLRDNGDSSYSLEDICSALTSDGHGRSTVYRIVSELVGEGAVRRLSDGRTRHCTYQYVGDECCHRHLHLKCKGCGRLVHLDEDVSRDFERAVMNVGGFMIEEGTLLFGRCKDCTEVTA